MKRSSVTRSFIHDLRGTAVTRIALSGCTTARIAAITGHSPRDVEEILKAHYLGGQADPAEQTIVQWVAAFGRRRSGRHSYNTHRGGAQPKPTDAPRRKRA